ncbi:MAG: protein kinase domain-containing protein [Planctomycetota bacterium]
MEFQGDFLWLADGPLSEHPHWSAFKAQTATGATAEVRLLHATQPARTRILRCLRLLQAIRHPGLRLPIDQRSDASPPWFALNPAGQATAFSPTVPLTIADAAASAARLFDGLAETHRLGLISGPFDSSSLVCDPHGVWQLDLLAHAGAPTVNTDPEEDVASLSTVLLQLSGSHSNFAPIAEALRPLLISRLPGDEDSPASAAVIAGRLRELAQSVDSARPGHAAVVQARLTAATLLSTPGLPLEGTLVLPGQHAANAPQSTPRILPDQLGRFRLIRQLGEGAAGTVYLAEDTADGSPAAVKVLNERLATNTVMLRRFTKEARLLARSRSPWVAALLDSNCDHGFHFLALEFVPGGSLADSMHENRGVPEQAATRVVLDATLGLAAAHRESICHRDIKPDNILLTMAGADFLRATADAQTSAPSPVGPLAKLSDFGLARAEQQSESMALTRDGTILGTPLYMSPEQCRGQTADARSDVYSLGATLFHLLAGRPPFLGENQVAVLNAHCNHPLPSLRQLCPALSDACINVVEKCLAKNPDVRYANADELAADLERLVNGQPASILAHPAAPETGGRSVFEYRFTCQLHSTPAQLWPHVAHTDRVNHALGLAPVTYTHQRHPVRGLERFAETKVAGQKLTWKEHPYEWIEGRRFSVLREFISGPFLWFMNVVELQPGSSGGTLLTQTFRAVPTSLAGKLLCRVELSGRAPRGFRKLYQQLDQFLLQGAGPSEDPFGVPVKLAASARRKLRQRLEQLLDAGANPSVVDVLGQFLQSAPDLEAARIRPLVFAERFGLPPADVLHACLLAARHGLLLHLWDLLCPSCRIPADVQETLAALKDHHNCSACDLEYSLDFDSSVELIFKAHPDLRQTETRTWCIGGPAFSSHVVAQIRLAPGERFDLELALAEGGYRLRGPQLPFTTELVVSAGASAPRAEISLQQAPLPGSIPVLRHHSQVLALFNNTSQNLQLRVERTADRRRAVTAAAAAALPLFRELFPGDVLAPGRMVAIASTTLLLVELVDAESLYHTFGDGAAFSAIRSRLQQIDDTVREAGGTVVKIVGEGSLAVFPNVAAALHAALRLIQTPTASSNPAPQAPQPAPITLRLALNHGAAMVATLNDRLDYFGNLVVTTRHMLTTAQPNELLLPAALAFDEDLQPMLLPLQKQSTLKTIPNGPTLMAISPLSPPGERGWG